MKVFKYLITLIWLPSDLILAYAFAFTGIILFGVWFIIHNIILCVLYYLCGCKEIEQQEKEKEEKGEQKNGIKR